MENGDILRLIDLNLMSVDDEVGRAVVILIWPHPFDPRISSQHESILSQIHTSHNNKMLFDFEFPGNNELQFKFHPLLTVFMANLHF